MPYVCYVPHRFRADGRAVVAQAEAICAEYAAQGFDLTLRQLYYQFVARDLFANTQQNYKRLGDIVNAARLAGLLDWDYIVDRTRNVQALSHWGSPRAIIGGAAASYRLDKWADQRVRVEVWIEKDALVGVIEDVCERNDVPYFSCRGYVSQSEAWGASQRLIAHLEEGQSVVILHLGDHDPSGLDMTRDIRERLALFTQAVRDRWRRAVGRSPVVQVQRIALTWAQVAQYRPPPNFAKEQDARYRAYVREHGPECWELDALSPPVLDALIEQEVTACRNDAQWQADTAREHQERKQLAVAQQRWVTVAPRFFSTAPLGTHGGDRRSPAFQGNNGNLAAPTKRGNSAAYWRARLARDAPAYLQALDAGRFRSVRAAVQAARDGTGAPVSN
jgi:hypothetical protein